jgi:hypothetical protein
MNRPRVRPEDVEIRPEDLAPKAKPKKSNLRPLLNLLLVFAVVILLLFFVLRSCGSSETPPVGTPTVTASGGKPKATPTLGEGQPTLGPDATSNPEATLGPDVTPEATLPVEPTADVNPQPTGDVQPTQPVQPTPAPPSDLANAQPALVEIGQPTQAGTWYYTFPNVAFSNVIAGPVGTIEPKNRWLVVLMYVNNDSGGLLKLPADFFVVKDAQGRIYRPNVEASQAYKDAGNYADVTMKDDIDPGVNVSIPILFDVSADATDLVIFSRYNTASGYAVRANMQ